jgi:hypothetical protein
VCVNTHLSDSNDSLVLGILLKAKDNFCTAATLLLYKQYYLYISDLISQDLFTLGPHHFHIEK